MIDRLRSIVAGSEPDLYAVLDIGTADVKALLLLVDNNQAAIIGAGRQAQPAGAADASGVLDAGLVTQACEQALSQAESLTETVVGEKLVADRAIIGLSGSQLKSVCHPLTVRRPNPRERISESELRAAVQRAERLVLQQAHEQAGGEVGLADADIVELQIDGYAVTKLTNVTGAQIGVRLSNVFAPLSYLAKIGSIVTTLEMETAAMLCGACAVARTPYLESRGDSIILDIGGECTDILMVRHGGIECLRSLPLGSAALTRQAARTLGVQAPAAEEAKRSYSAGQLPAERSQPLAAAFAAELAAWMEGVQAALHGMAAHEDLPAHIFLCGGGAALPDIERTVRDYRWPYSLPFEHHPQVSALHPRLLSDVTDNTQQAHDESFVVPFALASWALHETRAKSASVPQNTLKQVLHGMGLS